MFVAVDHKEQHNSGMAHDGNGNVGQVLAANGGGVNSHYEYDAFGNVIVSSGSGATSNVYRFSTKYADDETGLVYYGYRYFDPRLGRWTQRDPLFSAPLGSPNSNSALASITLPDELALYTFIQNNPLWVYDAHGMFAQSFDCSKEQTDVLRTAEADALREVTDVWELLTGDRSLAAIYRLPPAHPLSPARTSYEGRMALIRYHTHLTSVIGRVYMALKAGNYNVECECSATFPNQDDVAYVWYPSLYDGNIHFNPVFFEKNVANRGGTIMHELSHKFAHTGHGPFRDPAIVLGSIDPNTAFWDDAYYIERFGFGGQNELENTIFQFVHWDDWVKGFGAK